MAAPEAALMAAMMARVVLDIVKKVGNMRGVVQLLLYERCWRLMSAYDLRTRSETRVEVLRVEVTWSNERQRGENTREG